MLEELARKVEEAEPTAHCLIDRASCQIVVRFDNRPDTEIALLTPFAQAQIRKGKLDRDIYSDLLFSVRKIANYAIQ